MELRHLRYFVALAERLNFTAAAKFLGIKQPPLSVQIRNLETELGGPLFHRERRRIQLTPLGLLLLDEARALLLQADQTGERIRDAAEGRAGEIRLGYTQSAQSERITRRIRKFLRKQRGTRLSIVKVPYCESVLPMAPGLDALITECFEAPPEALILECSPVEIAIYPKHRLAERTEVHIADLVGENVLLSPYEKRSPVENYFAKDVESQKLVVEITQSSSDFAERLWQVSLGSGITVCTSADRITFDAVRIPLANAPELLTIAIACPASRSPALPAFLEAIRE
jgi:DNA-binding transcriptional LysR family regulator